MSTHPADTGRVTSLASASGRASSEREAMDPPIQYTQTRVVPVPSETLSRHKIVAGLRRDQAAGAFRMLRTQVLRRMQHHGWRTLAVVSPAPNDGKTLVTLNLAISISRDKHHTALAVDFDLHCPSVAGCFELMPSVGIDSVLQGQASVADAMFNPGINGLTVLPATGAVEDASELLASHTVSDLVYEFRDRYRERIVVFDLPPVLATDDAIAFMPNVDAVLLVVRDGKHTPEELYRVRELIEPVPVLGAVLNCVDLNGQPYYYGYY